MPLILRLKKQRKSLSLLKSRQYSKPTPLKSKLSDWTFQALANQVLFRTLRATKFNYHLKALNSKELAYLINNCKSLNKFHCSYLWCLTIRDKLNNSSSHSHTKEPKDKCSSLSNLLNLANNPSVSKISLPELTSTLNNTSLNPPLNHPTTSPPQTCCSEAHPEHHSN